MSLPKMRRRVDALEDPLKTIPTVFVITTPMFMTLSEACQRLGQWPDPNDKIIQMAILRDDQEPY